MNTAIIIVNWNGREHLEACLNSVFKQTEKKFEVIFVDNASTDDSVDYVIINFPQVRIIREKKNTGFSEGNNIGFRAALEDQEVKYIVTLNNDTEVKPDWLENLLSVVEKDKKVGAVCSKTLFFNQRNIIDSAGDFILANSLKVVTRGYHREDRGQFENIEECFTARAAAALYRREMLEEVRLGRDFFDSHYFAYVEDTDLSIRARLQGWKIMYTPKSVAYHKVAQTSSRLSYAFRRYYSGRNRIFTAIKNYPVSMWPLALKGTKSVDEDYSLSFYDGFKVYLKILASLIISLPRLLRQRKVIQGKKKINDDEIKSWSRRFPV